MTTARAIVGAAALHLACGGHSPPPADLAGENLDDVAPATAGETADVAAAGDDGCLVSFVAPVPIVAGAVELPPEFVAARDKFKTAMAARAGDPQAAAEAFLRAASAYRAVPDDSDYLEHALDDADSCYRNAAASYARAGLLEKHGRARIEAEAAGDERMAGRVAAGLAEAPADCARPKRTPSIPARVM